MTNIVSKTTISSKNTFLLTIAVSFCVFVGGLFFGKISPIQGAFFAMASIIGFFGWYSINKKTQERAHALSEAMNGLVAGSNDKLQSVIESFSEFPEVGQALWNFETHSKNMGRVTLATDCVTSCVMVADNEFNIVYCNPAMINNFGKVEGEIRKVYPQFSLNKIIGMNMDVFHKNPAHQRGMIGALKEAAKTRIKVGACTYDLVASPIYDNRRNRYGTVVEWKEITAELRIEGEVTSLIEKVSAGDFSYRIDLADKEGFMRNLSDGMNKFTEVTSSALKDVLNFLSELAKGNLNARMSGSYGGLLEEIKINANQSAVKLDTTMQTVISNTVQIRDASSEIAEGSNDLSSRTENQASSLEETAASIEEITAAVKSNSENAQRASKMSSDAAMHASRGAEVIEEAVHAMGRIQESSQKIAEITNLIDEIAFQTNLLALNASVEAARAGDFGKGFAVVAQEVRALAEHSAQASKQIKALIESSSESVSEGSKLVDQAKVYLGEIVGAVQDVSEMIQSINLASSEQSVGLDQINHVVTQLDAMTQKNAALVTQNVATTASLDERAQELRSLLGFFRTGNGADMSGGSSSIQYH